MTAITSGSTPIPRTGRFAVGKRDKKNYEFARLLCRARYYPGHAARRDAYVVQHVRRDARFAEGTKEAKRRSGEKSARQTIRRCSAPARINRQRVAGSNRRG